MSVSFDMFWYWREEFGLMYNPYDGEEGIPANAQTQPTTPGELPEPTPSEYRAVLTQRGVQDYEQAMTQTTAPGLPQANTATTGTVTSAPQPVKMDPATLPQHPLATHPAPLGFDGGWEGEAYMFPPMLDQFPDYDWAASFDFSNDPSQMQVPQLQQPVNMGPMNAGPVGYPYG